VLIKDEQNLPQVQAVCTQGLNLFRSLMIYLTPVIPAVSRQARELLGEESWHWQDAGSALLARKVSRYKPLLTRVETSQVEKMVEQSKHSDDLQAAVPQSPEITIDEFARVDLRIATIVKAEPVEGADKLLRLTLDLGDGTRNVFAGIKAAYEPAQLEGRQVVAVANLQPRKMRFGVSDGMVLAAGPGGKDIFLLSPDAGAQAGMRVK
jgi:methionyl-tRNA synthetase